VPKFVRSRFDRTISKVIETWLHFQQALIRRILMIRALASRLREETEMTDQISQPKGRSA
jgi:hypothetical protein